MPGSPEQQLPPKEMSTFKRIVKCYEHKQYKNGLKFAKQILSQPKYSEHGETLAMKGLILNNIGKKEEAYECVKRGLKNDVRSSICWHVFGLLQRSDRKYDEAMKAYKCALRLDKENMQILRDLALLQIQMRDMDGYRDTRYTLLQLRPSQKPSWIGYAMAFHLLKDYHSALNILEEFCRTQTPKNYDYDHSELLLYRAEIMIEAGMLEQALTLLQTGSENGQIVDHTACSESIGQLLLKLGRYDDATKVYWELIERNPENRYYYESLEEAVRPVDLESRLWLCLECERKSPRATMPRKLPLEFLPADHIEFHARMDKFLRSGLHKGVPPLFMQLQSLYGSRKYSDNQKIVLIEKLVRDYITSLESCSRFSESDTEFESPTTLIWANYFLAQHLNITGLHVEALEIVDKQLEITPTLIELYSLKGQIYRDSGDPVAAAQWLEEAQSLDTADRYINSVCARYLIQADQISTAVAMAGKFTRENTPASEHLNEMQCMWFLTECAASYRRQGRLGEALKKCHEVERHFAEIQEDQFDFHTYCLRKMTLRSYVEMLRLEDNLRSHPFYFTAAQAAIEIYMYLYSNPLGAEDADDDAETRNLSAAELKKLRNKQRKARRKAEEQAERARQEEARREALQRARQADRDPDAEPGPKEEALDPSKLARPENPLSEAENFLLPLTFLCKNNILTHCLAYEVYSMKGKILRMLHAIKSGAVLDRSFPRFHRCLVRFRRLLETDRAKRVVRHVAVEAVLERELPNFFSKCTAVSLNEDFLREYGSKSLPHLVAGTLLSYELDPSTQEECIQTLTQFDPEKLEGVTWQECWSILLALRGDGRLGAVPLLVADDFRAKCARLFPLCANFRTDTDPLPRPPPGLLNGDTAASNIAPVPVTDDLTNAEP